MTAFLNPHAKQNLHNRVVQAALRDSAFHSHLTSQPRAAVESVLGTALPHGTTVRVVEESTHHLVLVLPYALPQVEEGELSFEELEAVAGGLGTITTITTHCGGTCTCTNACTGNTCEITL